MNKKALKTLEYDKIIDLLAARATSPLGAELCRSLTPLEVKLCDKSPIDSFKIS